MKWYAGQNLPKTHAKPTFSEAWFHSRYGLTFGERYCTDPVFRTEQDREARRLLYERFGQAGIGEKDPRPLPHLEVCGHRFLPALFGCEIVYQDDQAPACRHLPVAPSRTLSKRSIRPWARCDRARRSHEGSSPSKLRRSGRL